MIEKSAKSNIIFDKTILKVVVDTNEKKRFTFDEKATKIRANQGHSIEVDLELKSVEPPMLLYHGTVKKFIDSIKHTGLQKMNRQHVHLSKDIKTATILEKIKVEGAVFLNDISIDSKGIVYVSDTRAGNVYKIEDSNKEI